MLTTSGIRRTAVRCAIVVATLGCAACHVGPRVQKLSTATTPHGTQARLNLSEGRGTLTGEVVALRESDLLMQTDRGLTSVSLTVFEQVDLEDGPRFRRWTNSPTQRESVTQYSRYPFGATDDIVAGILRGLDQDELFEIR